VAWRADSQGRGKIAVQRDENRFSDLVRGRVDAGRTEVEVRHSDSGSAQIAPVDLTEVHPCVVDRYDDAFPIEQGNLNLMSGTSAGKLVREGGPTS
jgi:hypothetical protein